MKHVRLFSVVVIETLQHDSFVLHAIAKSFKSFWLSRLTDRDVSLHELNGFVVLFSCNKDYSRVCFKNESSLFCVPHMLVGYYYY